MDPTRFYGKNKDVRIRPFAEDSGDRELSSEDDDIDETCAPEENHDSDSTASDSDPEPAEAPSTSLDMAVPRQCKVPSRNLLRRQSEAVDIIAREPIFSGQVADGKQPQDPIDYFRDIINQTIMDLFVNQSNIYNAQTNINQTLSLDENELEQFIGILFMI